MEYLNGLLQEREMCVKEFFFLSAVSVCVVLLFPSTRWSCDSIAPRDSLPTESQDRNGSLLLISMQGDKSGVAAEPHLIRTTTLTPRWSRTDDGWSTATGRFVYSPKVKVLYAKTMSIHSFIQSSMAIPCYKGTEEKYKNLREQESKKAEDRKCFLHSQTKNSIFFRNSHSLTFIRCRVFCWAQMHRLNADRGRREGKRHGRDRKRRKWRGRGVKRGERRDG